MRDKLIGCLLHTLSCGPGLQPRHVPQLGTELPYFSDYKMHTPQIWEENGGASYSPNVAYLVYGGRGQWSGVTGRRSRVAAAAGSRGRQDWGDAVGPGLGGGGVPVVDAREAGAESPLQHTIVLGRRVQGVQAR